MLKTVIVLPNGTEIASGVGTRNAIASCSFTDCVNSGTELTLGSVCSNMLELKLITPDGGLQIMAGDEITVYKTADDGTRRKLGVFVTEKPVRSSAHTMKLTAFDRICKLDRDLTQWLAELPSWPYSLYDMAVMTCEACGLELINEDIPNGSYMVQPFIADGITGRKIMQWIGEAAGRFCRATADGQIEFAWYEPVNGHSIGTTLAQGKSTRGLIDSSYDEETGTLTLTDGDMTILESDGAITVSSSSFTVTDDGNGAVSIISADSGMQHFYFLGGLSFEDYEVAKIEKVQIQSNEDDVGVVWPNIAEAVNTYRITGNMLLTDQSIESLRPVAETLYNQLSTISYTPCSVTIPSTLAIRAGHIVTITDRNRKVLTAYVMTKKQNGQKDTIECTGSHSRDSVSAVNEQSYASLTGKILNLRTDVEGIRAENKAADGRIAALELNVDGISTRVEKQALDAESIRNDMVSFQQTATGLKISVQSIRDDGVSKVETGAGYTFNDEGLKISRAGSQMANLLDNTGMYVKRGNESILQANSDGVIATDVRVRNYLCIGTNARLEDYGGNRTACFYVGG